MINSANFNKKQTQSTLDDDEKIDNLLQITVLKAIIYLIYFLDLL